MIIMFWTLGECCRNEYNSPTTRKATERVTATHMRIKNFDRRDRYSTMGILRVLSDSSVPKTGTSVQTPLRAGCFTGDITTPQSADSSAARLRKLSSRFSRRDCPLSAVSTLLTCHVPGGGLAAYSSTRSEEARLPMPIGQRQVAFAHFVDSELQAQQDQRHKRLFYRVQFHWEKSRAP